MRNVPYTKLLSSSKRAEKKLVRACKWFAMRLGPMELRRVNNYRPTEFSVLHIAIYDSITSPCSASRNL